MRRSLGILLGAGALAVALGGVGSVLAADPPAAVKDRVALMKAMGGDMGTVKKFTEGGAEAADAQKAADDLVAKSTQIVALFPKGTSLTEFPGQTGAKPAIWTEHDKFEAAAKTFGELAQKLQAAAKAGDKTQVADAFGNLGKNGCGGCHTPYREKLN